MDDDLKVGDKFIWKHQGMAFVCRVKKVGKHTYYDGGCYIKKREAIKWTKEKQKLINDIKILSNKASDLFWEIK